MTHTIQYSAESAVTDLATAQSIMTAVNDWANGDASHQFDAASYDPQNGSLRIAVRVTGVGDIDNQLSALDTGLDSINTGEGASYPMASDVASIRPE